MIQQINLKLKAMLKMSLFELNQQ